MTVEIDPFPVAALLDRYNLGKQAVYNRIDALGIKTFKQGNRQRKKGYGFLYHREMGLSRHPPKST
jgi:hypothetical protein